MLRDLTCQLLPIESTTTSNESILSSIASIFGFPVYTVRRPGMLWDSAFILSSSVENDSASLRATLRAAHGWLCNKVGNFVPVTSLYADRLDKASLSPKLSKPAGDEQLLSKYTLLLKKRMEIEEDLVEKFGRK